MSLWIKIRNFLTIQPSLNEDQLFLKKVSFMKALTNQQIILFARFIQVRHFKKGEFIFKEDYPHVVLYFIKHGEIELLPHRNSSEPLMVLSKYQYVGIEELFLDSRRWSSAVAKTDCTLLGISKFNFKSYVKRNPRAGVKILYGLCSSFSRYIKHCLTDKVQENNDENS